MRFVITEFADGTTLGERWRLPAGATGAISLAPESSADRSVALCSFADNYVPPPGAIDFGSGSRLEDCPVSGIQRSGLEAKLKLPAGTLSAGRLGSLLHEAFLRGDPQGMAGPRPFPIIRSGIAPFYLANLLVASFPLTLNSPGNANSVALLKRCHEEIYQRVLTGTEPAGMHRKWLGWKLRELGLADNAADQIASTRVPSSERIPLKPATSITDDFSSGNLNNWTAVNGTWTNASSDAELSGPGVTHCGMYHNTVLSGSDHYAQCDWSKGDNFDYFAFGPRIRMSSSGDGFALFSYTGGGGNPYVIKIVGANYNSTVGNASDGITSSPHTLKISITGSSITAYWDGTLKLTLTDTSFPSNLKVGVHGYINAHAGGIDNFSAADISSGTTYNESMSGGLTLGGGATYFARSVPSVGGAITLGGSGSCSTRAVPAPSGGATLSGSATVSTRAVPSPSGTITMGGSGSISQQNNPSTGGTITLGGSSSPALACNPSIGGQVTLGGSASLSTAASVVGSGGAALSGSSTITASYSPDAGGAVSLAGDASVYTTANLTGTGSFALAGSASVAGVYEPSPTGGIVIGGSATVLLVLGGGGELLGDITLHASLSGTFYVTSSTSGLLALEATTAGDATLLDTLAGVASVENTLSGTARI